MTRLFSAFILLLFQPTHADDRQYRPSLRTRQDVSREKTDDISSESARLSMNHHRDLSSIAECHQSTSMEIPLIPANMKYLLHNKGNDDNTRRPQMSPNNANLIFCLDRIYLDLSYILDIGTLVTDLDIECPHLSAPVHFLEPNYVISANPNARSRFFVSGKFPGQVHLKNEDVLRILADGEDCEFKVKAYNFNDGLLIGQLRGDAFKTAAHL